MKRIVFFFTFCSLQFGYCQEISEDKTKLQSQSTLVEVDVIVRDFIVFGLIDESNSEKIKLFKRKYHVGIKFQNCTVDPVSFKNARDNNNKVANYLTNHFGNEWKKEIPYALIGVVK